MSTYEQPKMPLALFVERIISIMTVLGFICLFIGLILYVVGRASGDLIVGHVGAYVLLFGIALVAMRVFYWVLEELVGRGMESMEKEEQIRSRNARFLTAVMVFYISQILASRSSNHNFFHLQSFHRRKPIV